MNNFKDQSLTFTDIDLLVRVLRKKEMHTLANHVQQVLKPQEITCDTGIEKWVAVSTNIENNSHTNPFGILEGMIAKLKLEISVMKGTLNNAMVDYLEYLQFSIDYKYEHPNGGRNGYTTTFTFANGELV